MPKIIKVRLSNIIYCSMVQRAPSNVLRLQPIQFIYKENGTDVLLSEHKLFPEVT